MVSNVTIIICSLLHTFYLGIILHVLNSLGPKATGVAFYVDNTEYKCNALRESHVHPLAFSFSGRKLSFATDGLPATFFFNITNANAQI